MPVETINKIGKSLLEKATSNLISTMGVPHDATTEEKSLYGTDGMCIGTYVCISRLSHATPTSGPLWYRSYAMEEDERVICDQVEEVRAKLGVRRLVMGHTPNFDGIVSRCRGRLLLIDSR